LFLAAIGSEGHLSVSGLQKEYLVLPIHASITVSASYQRCLSPDEYDMDNLFCEGLGPIDSWLKYCGTDRMYGGK